MSVKVMTAVFDHSRAMGNDRLVLLAIADEAKDDGTNAYPGFALLETKTRIPKRTIVRCIERLEKLGELTAVRPETPGRGRFTVYTVVLPGIGDTLTPIPDEKGCGKVPDRCQIGDTPPLLTSTDTEYAVRGTQNPKIIRPPDDARTDQQLITDAFTAFWKAYPRKTAKGEARKAWPRAIKAAGGDLGKIVGGVRRYAADPNLPEPQFIPHPAKWLNDERWDDGPLPPRATNGHRPESSANSVFQVVGSDGFLIE